MKRDCLVKTAARVTPAIEGFWSAAETRAVRLALEITRQVGAGLAAVHKQNLVHRDIKPSNIMVSLDDAGTGAVTASGRAPFRGTPAELMHQHLHAPLPVDQFGHLPQPVVALLQALLEKDPARRVQSPGELLQALPAVEREAGAARASAPQQSQPMLRDAASGPTGNAQDSATD